MKEMGKLSGLVICPCPWTGVWTTIGRQNKEIMKRMAIEPRFDWVEEMVRDIPEAVG
jgi:hypothetical protein